MKKDTILLTSILLCSTIANASNATPKSAAEEVFTKIYETNFWGSSETVSGGGSTIQLTKNIRPALSKLIRDFQITSIADAPCGDFNWMKLVDLGSCSYLGIDIVKELVEENRKVYSSALRQFKHLNLLEDLIDQVDLIICRDLLAHLPFEKIFQVLKNFKQSGSKYLLVTTNLRTEANYDIITFGGWRKLDLQMPPFNFPEPLALIEEDVPFEAERGKHLGLWLLEDIPA